MQGRFFDNLPKANLVSQLVHFPIFYIQNSNLSLNKGWLIVSTDVDVGCPELGILNKGKNDREVNDKMSEYEIGKIEEEAFPIILNVFDDFKIPITLAIRGQLTELDSKFMQVLLNSETNHEIGAHGYYHKSFTSLTYNEAKDELDKIYEGMKKYGIKPNSFIFPKNLVHHLDLLEDYDYFCYRGLGGHVNDRMNIDKSGSLYNIQPSLFIDNQTNPILLIKMLNISIQRKLPFHIWFHFWNFGTDAKSVSRQVKRLFIPFLSYAKRKQELDKLEFVTMFSAAKKVNSPDV